MSKKLPSLQLQQIKENIQLGEKEGIKIEKGIALTEPYLISIQEELEELAQHFSAYPDLYLDLITPEKEELNLFFYQRIILRALMRFKEIYWTACVTGKTKVRTSNGEKKISEIKKGEYVMSHLGWRQVVGIDNYEYKGNIFSFSLNNEKRIRCTDDHIFLIKREGYKNPLWIEAWNIKLNDKMLVKKDSYDIKENYIERSRKNSLSPMELTNLNLKDYLEIDISEIDWEEDVKEKVYTLIVDEAESFEAEGVINHNCRATSKTFLSILALFLQCIFMPGTKRFIVATFKVQAAKVAKEKIVELYDHWPLLRREVFGGDISDTPGNFGKDYITIKFRNNSQLDVVGGDGTRGLRRMGGLLDELRDADATEITEIVLPLMNVARRLPDNTVNPKEPNAQQIVMTSAGVKTSYAYDKLIDMFENSIISPKDSFVIGMDYRIPIMHDLLDRQFIKKLKSSPSFNEESFGREYMSLWTGSSEESWFNFDKLQKYRKIKNPELHAKNRISANEFYLISADVGRLHDSTVCCIFRINIIQEKYYATLVNIIVLGRTPETKPFSIQAADLKKIIRDYHPKEVVIDTNGLGVGLGDEMIRVHYDENGEVLPAYGFFNDDNYKKVQPKDAINILYGIKANGPLNSKIHGNAYSRISSGSCRFLIKEQEAKSALLATKVGQKMKIEERIKRLMPHEMTTKLFQEMANLRLKRTGGMDIVLEQINPRFPKDKYSAFAYGLYRIKELEEENYKKKRHRSGGKRQLVFFSGGF